MATTQQELPQEVRKALDDLRLIRQTIDATDTMHPLRVVMRSLMAFGAIQGPVTIAYGVIAQRILDGGEPVLGLSPTWAVLLLSVVAFVLMGVTKAQVVAAASRRAGFDVGRIYRVIFTETYVRVALPMFGLLTLTTVALALAGASSMIFGVVTFGVSAIWLSYATIYPLREFTGIAVVGMILSVVTTFLWPEYSFYKIAAVYGLGLGIGSLILYKRFPSLEEVRRATGEEDA